MNWKNLVGVISLMLLFFISCDVENTGNNQKKRNLKMKRSLKRMIIQFRYFVILKKELQMICLWNLGFMIRKVS